MVEVLESVVNGISTVISDLGTQINGVLTQLGNLSSEVVGGGTGGGETETPAQ